MLHPILWLCHCIRLLRWQWSEWFPPWFAHEKVAAVDGRYSLDFSSLFRQNLFWQNSQETTSYQWVRHLLLFRWGSRIWLSLLVPWCIPVLLSSDSWNKAHSALGGREGDSWGLAKRWRISVGYWNSKSKVFYSYLQRKVLQDNLWVNFMIYIQVLSFTRFTRFTWGKPQTCGRLSMQKRRQPPFGKHPAWAASMANGRHAIHSRPEADFHHCFLLLTSLPILVS